MPGILGWRFLTAQGIDPHSPGTTLVKGRRYHRIQQSVLGKSGFHASRRSLDALSTGSGPIIARVLLYGDLIENQDQVCADRVQVIWTGNATETLASFITQCAIRTFGLFHSPDFVYCRKLCHIRDAFDRNQASQKEVDEALKLAEEETWDHLRALVYILATPQRYDSQKTFEDARLTRDLCLEAIFHEVSDRYHISGPEGLCDTEMVWEEANTRREHLDLILNECLTQSLFDQWASEQL